MRPMTTVAFAMTLLAFAAACEAAEGIPELPAPEKEHAWLQQLVGEWETEGEATFGPGQPPITCQGTESVRALGGFWVVSETHGNIMGMEMKGMMTLGYDAAKKKYVGTWIDSSSGFLWKYEGEVDAAGKTLTLEAEGEVDAAGKTLTLEADGPNPLMPGKLSHYRDVIEIKSKDHKVMTSSLQGADGSWTQFMTMNIRRKK